MNAICAYQLFVNDSVQKVEMPLRATTVRVAMQSGVLCFWALVPTTNVSLCTRRFRIRRDGDEFDARDERYVGSATDGYGDVWHVLEVTR